MGDALRCAAGWFAARPSGGECSSAGRGPRRHWYRHPAAFNSVRNIALKGDRKGQYSIRINDQWRICFAWPGKSPGPTNVEIVDYH
ncbi:MAG: type II toxin-antitoxin system RelE/ParE family toxin [Burkholderiales bacterium]|nr:type II toxin-antitoxin system RelE/ParE family toxin [Burkholderiales bacterium]